MKERYGFGNLGRAKNKEQVVQALNKLEKAGRRIFLNEIGEGDQGYNDKALVREALSDTHILTHINTKEPIAVPKSQKILKEKVFWKGKGVKRQSPNRTLHETWIDHGESQPVEVLIGGHFYAGAMNGERPAKVKKILVALYWAMLAALKARVAWHRSRGRHVVWMIDTNWRKFPKTHRKEQVIFSQAPDRGAVIPARGWKAKISNVFSEDQPIEAFHDLHFSTIEFIKI